MQLLSLVLLFSFGTVFISDVLGEDLGCSSYDLPELSTWIEEGCDENKKKYECMEGYKMIVSTTCGLGKWNETVQCVKEEEEVEEEEEVNFCEQNPCLNGGTCINGESNYTCVCAGLWKGDTCGTCYSFSHLHGYIGSAADFRYDGVSESVCENDCAVNPLCVTYFAFTYICEMFSKPRKELDITYDMLYPIGEKNC